MESEAMTPKERMAGYLGGQEVDRLPCVPLILNHAARVAGMEVSEHNRSGEAMGRAHVAAFRRYRQDMITIFTDTAVLAEEEARIPFVGPDNREGARLAGDYLAKRLQAGDKVALIGGIPSAFNAVQRRLGFEDAMKEGGMRVVASQAADWETDKANQVTSGILIEHPDLKAILCANDSMALGAVAALRAAGKLDQVKVVGFDNISAVQELMKEGHILCTVDQHADRIAVFGIQYALEILAKKSTPKDLKTKVDLIPAESVK